MAIEKMRMDLISLNLANSKTTHAGKSGVYKPLTLIAKPSNSQFSIQMDKQQLVQFPMGVDVKEIVAKDVPGKIAYEPGHPDADANGFVEYPGVDSTTEMINMIKVTRAYEANVRALNAAKLMAKKALEIGG